MGCLFRNLGKKVIGLLLFIVGAYVVWVYVDISTNYLTVEAISDPIEQMRQLEQKGQWQELKLYADFVMSMPFYDDQEKQIAQEMYKKAEEELNSLPAKVVGFLKGFFTGKVEDLSSFAGSTLSNILLYGSIRDIAIEGYHLLSGEEVNELILAISAIDVVVTAVPVLKPEASAVKAVMVPLVKSGAISKPMAKEIPQILKNTDLAVPFIKSNYKLVQAFKSYGLRPYMDVYKYARNADDVSKMAKMAEQYGAPKTYFLLKQTDGKVLDTAKRAIFVRSKLWHVKTIVKTLDKETFYSLIGSLMSIYGIWVLVVSGLVSLFGGYTVYNAFKCSKAKG